MHTFFKKFRKPKKVQTETTRSHYHITLKNIQTEDLKAYAKQIKGKPTSIDLILDNHDLFKDRMLTKHQKGHSLLPLMEDVLSLEKSGAHIARYKLELDLSDQWDALKKDPNSFTMPLNRQNYIELHIKVINTFPLLEKTYKSLKIGISKNPKAETSYFYNIRVYTQEDFKIALQFLEKLENMIKSLDLPPLEVHKEYTLFDSHLKHDSNWL